jgi:hypothetical protein
LALRLPTIKSPLFGDEAISFNRYGHLSFSEILFNYPDSNQHALFSILSNFCLVIFGDNELAFRLPSLLAGVLLFPVVYYTSRSLGLAKSTSYVTLLLLALYVPHIFYSQEGRGYALTVFFAACLVLSSVHILGNYRLFLWGMVVVASATCMVITLPSNAIFVASTAGFCWVLNKFKHYDNPEKSRLPTYFWVSYILSFLLIMGYLLINLSDLQISAKANYRGEVQWGNFLEIAEFLVSPWGLWLYIFFVIGLFSKINNQIRYGFAALLLIPTALTLISGIVGFARVYIYFAPFVFMLVSIGFVFLCEKIKVINKNLMYVFLASSFFWVSNQPILSLANYYPERMQGGNGYMKDAIKMQKYISNQPLNILPVIMNAAPERSVLNHYLGENIGKRMELFVVGKKIEGILFLSKKGIPPNKYKLHQVFKEIKVAIPETSINLIKSFGSFQVYEWNVELSKIVHGKTDLDYERQLAGFENGAAKALIIKKPRAVGNTALLVENPTPSTNVLIGFPNIIETDMGDNEGFILNLYLKDWNSKMLFRTVKLSQDTSNIPSAYLNPYLNPVHSVFEERGDDREWEIVFLLSSVGKGKKMLQETIETIEEKAIIDGLGSYIIKLVN